jgi:MFS family permease
MMMLAVAGAGILSKRLVPFLILREGYRRVLVANTVLLGLSIASFALISPAQAPWLHALHLAVFGALNSIQFTAMNTITLKDLGHDGASSGNSMLSMVQMLSMSLGVAVAGAFLGTFTQLFHSEATQTLPVFQATFICVGLITSASAWIFWQLPPDAAAPREDDEVKAAAILASNSRRS